MEKSFAEIYKEACEELRAECDRMVLNGECDAEYADFRYFMVRDEILYAMSYDEE